MKHLVPDLLQADKFLSALDPNGIFTFQTFDDRKTHGNLAMVLHGSLEQHEQQLANLQQRGAGVFVMINQGDGLIHDGEKTCRCTCNVQRVRSLFVDLDGSPLEPVLANPYPDITIESSPGRFHAYWFTTDCPLDQFSLRQKQLASKFKGDHKVHDLPRVMRLPGFWHQKGEPFCTRILSTEEGKP